ncbi:hypothetical protein NF27_DP01010 [Candidatus Jidaibacter acanthamoeba]|uniref:Uncharacterized protein n=1 Tax=Candidatus Jidaibacter acanthamoebae TaxID=86105 RepID=A0A0C1MTY5_9RICK|nr:hypothetical protein NF27_DP01010 [Candidatus Jidaibacter acanthamoeba]
MLKAKLSISLTLIKNSSNSFRGVTTISRLFSATGEQGL